MNPEQTGRRIQFGRLFYVASTSAVALFFIASWTLVAVRAPDPLSVVMGDWIQFHRVGQRFAAGDWARIYPDSFPPGHHPDFPEGLYFLYPPFALPGTLLFAGMTPLQAYAACVTIVGAAGAAMIAVLVRTLRGTVEDGVLVGLGLVASGFYLGGLALGHLSVLLGLVVVVGLFLHQRAGLPLAAGAVWSLLLVKPNWGIPLLMLLLVGRCWREVTGFLSGAAGLVILGSIVDHGLWADWFHMVREYAEVARVATPPHRQVTLFASVQSLFGMSGNRGLVQAVWAAMSAGLALAAAAIWFRGREGIPFLRLFAMAIVVILAVNPYAYFYDGVPLVASAGIWWIRRDLYAPAAWAVIGSALGFSMVWEHLVMWSVDGYGLPSLTGIAIAAWAGTEMVDAVRGARSGRFARDRSESEVPR